MQKYTHFQVSTPTSGSCCWKCHEKIQRGSPRVGFDYTYYRWNGVRWAHLGCFGLSEFLEILRDIFQQFRFACRMLIIRFRMEML